MSSPYITVRERRVVEMECVCGDRREMQMYSVDLISDLTRLREEMAAFEDRHQPCIDRSLARIEAEAKQSRMVAVEPQILGEPRKGLA